MSKSLAGFEVDDTMAGALPEEGLGNQPERLEWFRDQALGMFIHWGVDSTIGSVESHGMVGASDRILDQYANELPALFEPRRFCADDYAQLAQTVGMTYYVFTTKHHSGFCMYDTQTTDYNVMKTPFARDITREYTEAFRKRGLAIGHYFSPLDFTWLRTAGIPIEFLNDNVTPLNNPGLMALNKAQLTELMTGYGDIDMVFFDGPSAGLNELTWQLQPEAIVTRGALTTPEQHLPDSILDEAWETCHTIGNQWNYKATNLANKTGTQLIEMLIETRAKGGNLLINVSPDPYGQMPADQEAVLRELGLWIFYNKPAVYNVRPWKTCRNGSTWYTKEKGTNTVYAYICDGVTWERAQRRDFILPDIRITEGSSVELVGQNGTILEHDFYGAKDSQTRFKQLDQGLFVSAMRCYRPYGNGRWPNPVVIRITEVEG